MPLIAGITPALDDKGKPQPGIPGVDIKCNGGYIVAPPSIHPDGPRYYWVAGKSPDEVELIHPAPWLLNACFAASRGAQTSADGTTSTDRWCDLIANGVSEGGRNIAARDLYGYLLRRHGPVLALHLLRLWNEVRCKPDALSDEEINAIASSICRREASKLEDAQ